MTQKDELQILGQIIKRGGLGSSYEDFWNANFNIIHVTYEELSLLFERYENLNYINDDFKVTPKLTVYYEKLKKEIDDIDNNQKTENDIKKNESKLVKWQVKTYWLVFAFAFIGCGYAIFDIVNTLAKKEIPQEQIVTKEYLKRQLNKNDD